MTLQITKSIKLGRHFNKPRLDTVIKDLIKQVPEDAEEITVHIMVPFSLNCINANLEMNLDEIPIQFETVSENDLDKVGAVYISFELEEEPNNNDFTDFLNA